MHDFDQSLPTGPSAYNVCLLHFYFGEHARPAVVQGTDFLLSPVPALTMGNAPGTDTSTPMCIGMCTNMRADKSPHVYVLLTVENPLVYSPSHTSTLITDDGQGHIHAHRLACREIGTCIDTCIDLCIDLCIDICMDICTLRGTCLG